MPSQTDFLEVYYYYVLPKDVTIASMISLSAHNSGEANFNITVSMEIRQTRLLYHRGCR